jgi:hypothetical protein
LIISQPSSLRFLYVNKAHPDLPSSFDHIVGFAMTVNRENSESTTADLCDFALATGGNDALFVSASLPRVSLRAIEE